ncbi:hypothetical protein, partial [Eikenella longinqua]|uniref:hypothetical protein n=1 Tax=Eikenella longinqua TaxID=1795827 RepID=UPI001C54EFF1
IGNLTVKEQFRSRIKTTRLKTNQSNQFRNGAVEAAKMRTIRQHKIFVKHILKIIFPFGRIYQNHKRK